VYTAELAELGAVHHGRKKVQPSRKVVRDFYAVAEAKLQHPIIRFDEVQRAAIGDAFEQVVLERNYTCYACAIMPDHVHLVVRKHRDSAERMIGNFQGASRTRLRNCALVPDEHLVWTKNGWKVFLNSPAEVWSRVRYVEKNPVKEGLAEQRWPFVVEYDNWPFHKQGGCRPR